MTMSDHFGCASLREAGIYRSPPAKTKPIPPTIASPKGGEEHNFSYSAARRLEESREALALSSGRFIEVPIRSASTALCFQATSCLSSKHSNICSTSTNTSASCNPSFVVTPTSLAKITSSPSFLLPSPDMRPFLTSYPPRAAKDSTLLRRALHNSESLRGLNRHNVRHRYTAWEIARAKMEDREPEQIWILEHGISSASSSGDEDDEFECGMRSSWSDILDEYEDEQMVCWDHWSGRKLQPDQLDDEY